MDGVRLMEAWPTAMTANEAAGEVSHVSWITKREWVHGPEAEAAGPRIHFVKKIFLISESRYMCLNS